MSQLSFSTGRNRFSDPGTTGGFHRRRQTTRDTGGLGPDPSQWVRLLFGQFNFQQVCPRDSLHYPVFLHKQEVNYDIVYKKQIEKINFISWDVGPVFYYIRGKHT